jgi:CBS domain-containing protein
MVSELIQGKATPLTINSSDSLEVALGQMSEHDYSQLPVTGSDRRPTALLTVESIARAVSHLGTLPGALRVIDAMEVKFETCESDDDLLDVLDGLQRASAVLVLNRQQELTGIITSFDAMEYFRRRSQDIMLVQDIEETIKDFILAAFRGIDGDVDEGLLLSAVKAITPNKWKELRGPFRAAVQRYVELRSTSPAPIDGALLAKAFEEHMQLSEEPKPFDRLALNEYIDLLLHKDRWASYGTALGIERSALMRLLHGVRDTRNDIAHFRSDISDQQRDELLFCKSWLSRQEDSFKLAVGPGALPPDRPTAPREPAESPAHNDVDSSVDVGRLDEVDDVDGSRYAPLGAWLEALPADSDRVTLTFSDIERLIGAPLPASARQYRSWWGNIPQGHAQTKQWLDVGWRVAGVSSRDEGVTFARNRERETAYRTFFTAVTEKLPSGSPVPGTARIQRKPSGVSWHPVAQAPESGPRAALFVVSFTRTRLLRIELYIDTGTQGENKRIFDLLHQQRASIEDAFGESLSWERMDRKRASRIAVYFAGDILNVNGLPTLHVKAATAMAKFVSAVAPALVLALEQDPKKP